MCEPSWIYVHHIHVEVYGGQTRCQIPELQTVVSCHVDTGNWILVLCRAANALNSWVISPALIFFPFEHWQWIDHQNIVCLLSNPFPLSLRCFSLHEAKLLDCNYPSLVHVWYVSRKHRYFPSFYLSSLHSSPEIIFIQHGKENNIVQ